MGAGKLREETALSKGYGGNPKRDGCGLAKARPGKMTTHEKTDFGGVVQSRIAYPTE